jgi:hypothetical protein
MGGELHPLKYGSYFNDKESLLSIIKAEENFILNSSGSKNRRIWIDLYETNLDDDIIDNLVIHLQTISHKIFKLCLVGCSVKYEKRINNCMKTNGFDLVEQVRYFKDAEEAKKWLIGEKQTL